MVRDTIFRDTLGRVGSFAGTLLRIGFLALLALMVVAFGRTWIERIAERASADPFRSGLAGFLGQVLFIPILLITIVVLIVSIIGIPLLVLLPFAFLTVMIVALVGFTGVAYYVGSLLAGRFGWSDRGDYVVVLLGVLAIALITLRRARGGDRGRRVLRVSGGVRGLSRRVPGVDTRFWGRNPRVAPRTTGHGRRSPFHRHLPDPSAEA